MPLAPGTRVGAYEIIAPLGAGAMGEVYRARDHRLERDVALKVLPESYVADPDRRARFEREARLLGALSHPHIAAIYGFEEVPADGGQHIGALVLELVEGDTLSERIAAGADGSAASVDEAVSIARQLVEALDAAHERGIIHRDLKPSNIKLTPDGVVKVLDFGLARATGESGSDAFRAAATLPVGGTQEGVILGTASYMSPEQARGRAVDRRADIWAFGCVIYETLTGRQAFPGETLSDVIAGVLGREPDWGTLPGATPASLRRLLRRCLEKDPRRRLRDIGDARIVLEELDEAPATTPMRAWTRRRRLAAAVAGCVMVLAAFAAGVWRDGGPTPAPVRAVKLQVAPPAGGAFVQSVETVSMAFSPDGSQLAFVATDAAGKAQIWLRALNKLDIVPVPGTDNASSVFWSPDGASLGFFAGGELKRLNMASGTPVVVCATPRDIGLFGTWGERGDALFAKIEGDAIFRVSMDGGTPAAVVEPDASRMESRVVWPWFLPGGDRFLYYRMLQNGEAHLMLGGAGLPPRPLLPMHSNAQYVEPGYLVFASEGVLLGQRFDASSGRLTGEPVAISDSVNYFHGTGRAVFTTSRTGAVAFQAHRDEDRLAWIDRTGREIGTLGTPGAFLNVRISPDGRKVLFDRAHPALGTYDLWVLDLDRAIETRLTSDRVTEGMPVWLPDNLGFFFSIARGAAPNVFRGNLATGAIAQVLPRAGLQQPSDVSPDGNHLVFAERAAGGPFDLWSLSVADNRRAPLAASAAFNETAGRFSPNGQYVAFMSNESGRTEVYVTPFPAGGRRTRVSPQGGSMPRWSRDGRELLYMSTDNSIMSVPVRTAPSLDIGVPVKVFTLSAGTFWRDYDLSLDGKRFLAIVPSLLSSAQPLTVVSNWIADLVHK